jgi:hypothetical protein
LALPLFQYSTFPVFHLSQFHAVFCILFFSIISAFHHSIIPLLSSFFLENVMSADAPQFQHIIREPESQTVALAHADFKLVSSSQLYYTQGWMPGVQYQVFHMLVHLPL